tara:strand:+ start:118 stop:909 length:792 start_codon:yes stop_codon:yes gene_type:complete
MKNYKVIGNPIDHSLSPDLHNFWLKACNIDAFYDKEKLEKSQIKDFINTIRRDQLAGANVTVPFKKIVIPYLDKLSSEAEKTQSVNTIVVENKKVIGHNTDVYGFFKAIKNLNFNIKNKKVYILGAGGVAPSIILALNKMEVSQITVSNRTRQKAENLKNQFNNLKIVDWGDLQDFDVIINATSLGLNKEKVNIDFSKIGNNKLFYDVIYNPVETDFLKEGKRLGNNVENGKMMFLYQAFESFRLWHGVEPEINNNLLSLLNR